MKPDNLDCQRIGGCLHVVGMKKCCCDDNSCDGQEDRRVVICRLTTSYWHDRNGIYSTRKLKFLHRKCKSFNFVQEDADGIGADKCWQRIINIDECKDGIYQVLTCNESRDWETGIIDDFKLVLI